jgi:hypothetical protein
MLTPATVLSARWHCRTLKYGTLSQRLQASLAIESGRNSVSNANALRGRPLARMLGLFMSQKRRNSRLGHDLRLL